MFELFDSSLSTGTQIILILSLLIACGFEFVNGFHDTANAVATVIYTNTLKPWIAVIWSGLCNFAGVLLGGISVAMGIIYLLPSELLVNKGTGAGLAMVMALLLAAILWNLGTWYYGLPASSSHTLIGAILGVGLANSMLPGHTFGDGVNWGKATEIGLSLLVSPLTGFSVAFLLLWLSKKLIPNEKLYTVPTEAEPPPLWIRLILIVTCTGVSFAHGSNDGQKGVGLIMLILIGILPASYALNATLTQTQLTQTVEAARQLDSVLQRYDDSKPLLQIGFAPDATGTPSRNVPALGTPISNIRAELADIQTVLAGKNSVKDVAKDSRWTVRKDILLVVSSLTKLEKGGKIKFSDEDSKLVKKNLSLLRGATDYAPLWVIMAVAISLGIGTTVGWKRIVITVGEKIGKSHLTYAQGASAELVAMSTIGLASTLGLPVSTTHVLSSGVAGTMVAQKAGLQAVTVRNIALAWILTLPVSICLSAVLFLIFHSLFA